LKEGAFSGSTEAGMMSKLLNSRKFFVLSLSLLATLFGAAFGVEITGDQIETMTSLLCAWLVAQGIQDAGASRGS